MKHELQSIVSMEAFVLLHKLKGNQSTITNITYLIEIKNKKVERELIHVSHQPIICGNVAVGDPPTKLACEYKYICYLNS